MYTNLKYISIGGIDVSICCYIDGMRSFVPLDPANTDYANIMALVEKGQLTIAPAEDKE